MAIANAPQSEPEAGVIQTLGLLAAPGAFIALLTMPLSFRSWDLVAFRFLAVSYSMIVMGVSFTTFCLAFDDPIKRARFRMTDRMSRLRPPRRHPARLRLRRLLRPARGAL